MLSLTLKKFQNYFKMSLISLSNTRNKYGIKRNPLLVQPLTILLISNLPANTCSVGYDASVLKKNVTKQLCNECSCFLGNMVTVNTATYDSKDRTMYLL